MNKQTIKKMNSKKTKHEIIKVIPCSIPDVKIIYSMFDEITPIGEYYPELLSELWESKINDGTFLWITVKLSAMYKGEEIANFYHGCNLLSNKKEYFSFDHLWRDSLDQLMPDVLAYFANGNNFDK